MNNLDVKVIVPSFLAGVGLSSLIAYYLSVQDHRKRRNMKAIDTEKDMIDFILAKLKKYPPILDRNFITFGEAHKTSNKIRVMQWNALARALCNTQDCAFSKDTPTDVYDWSNFRKWRLLEELIRHKSDIICLEEVDSYENIKPFMTSLGYAGIFMPKHQSPCLKQPNNTGPDGCVIFYKSSKFHINNMKCEHISINNKNHSQVYMIVQLKHKDTNSLITLVCLHLKAKRGYELIRRDQAELILKSLKNHLSTISSLIDHPIIICGDFNGEPNEAYYDLFVKDKDISLTDAYFNCLDAKNVRKATTFKVREVTGLVARTIDFIFYTNSCLNLLSYLNLPDVDQLDSKIALPNLSYPSDHFSLVCDFELLC